MSVLGGAATFATGMGLASSYDNNSYNDNTLTQTQQMQLAPAGAEEQGLSNTTTGLANAQAVAIKNLLGQNGFALSPEELKQLNAAYAGSESNLRRFGDLMGQDLAGTRGLNTSDTPVAEAVLREVLPAMASLQSDKMQTGLGLGLQNRALQLQGAQAMPQSLQFNLQRLFNERLAQGKTTNTMTSRGIFSPGFLDRLATASGAQNNETQAGRNLMGKSGFGI